MCASKPGQRVMNRRRPFTTQARAARGMSLVELMVGIVVALLVGLAASGSAVFFTASQRQAAGSSGAIVGATTALAAIKEEAAHAGLGFFGDTSYLCSGLNLSVGGTNFSQAVFSPLRVARAANGMDTIDMVFADQVAGGANVTLKTASNTTQAELESFMPAVAGHAVLMAPETAGTACTVRSVTQVTASTDATPQILTFGNVGKHNRVAFAGAVNYAAESRVSLLGALQWSRYRILNGDLVLDRPFDTANPTVTLVRNVVAFRVQYGVSAVGASAVTNWVEPDVAPWAAPTPATLARVRAIRIGLVTRSANPEKVNGAGNCVASEAQPNVLGFTVAAPAVNGVPWNCFRYRTATSVVPMRNLVMGLR